MKRFLFVTQMVLMTSVMMAQQTRMSVDVCQSGTLAECVGQKNKLSVRDLTVKGQLNAADVIFLREMAGRDRQGEEVQGSHLTRLDLKDASFVADTCAFFHTSEGSTRITKTGSDLPDSLFYQCHLSEIIFPGSLHEIGAYALFGNQLETVVLPEYAALGRFSFANNQLLKKVVFPQTLLVYAQGVFSGCDQLERLDFGNVLITHGQAFLRMNGLKEIHINGWLMHADGYTFIDCPELKTVDFHGDVYSTGGSLMARNCQKLEHVTFHAPIFLTYYGETDNCPSFKGVETKGIVVSPAYKNMISPSSDEEINAISEKLLSVLDQRMEQLKNDGYEEHVSEWTNIARGTLQMKEERISVLKNSAGYVHKDPAQGSVHFTFSYQEPTDSILIAIRDYFKLDSIMGNGDEISQIKNIMYWLHDAIRHEGNSSSPMCKYNAIELYELTQKENRGFNCRFLAEVLNDLYLAAGFKSRFLTCQSREYDADSDCHVINIVWSRSLGKWLWMDASFAAYVTDEKGLLLHPGEVRERLRNDQPVLLNDDANWNHQEQMTKSYYLDYYMAKNLYLMCAHLRSETESESAQRVNKSIEVALVPQNFQYRRGMTTYDDTEFWQKPE